MDDDLTQIQYAVPGYVLITTAIEVVACVVVLVTCLTLVRRSLAALLGAVGALLNGSATGLGLADVLVMLHRDAGPWQLPEWVWQVIDYGRAVGLTLLASAVLIALTRTRRPAPASAATA